MIPVLLIGYGNPLRSDDGIGWHAAQAFLGEWPSAQVRVESAHQLLPEMADWIGDAGFVIFIDACWDSVPGRIRSRRVHPEAAPSASMTHHFLPQGLLADARHLFHHAPEAVLVSIGGASFEHGEVLTDPIASALPALVAHIKKIVNGALSKAAYNKVESHA